MAFRTVWCVDIGRSALKAAQLRRDRNNVEILAIDKIDYTAGSEGFDPGQAREALSILQARNEIKDPVVVIHPGQGTFMRFIKIPAFDDKKLAEMVGYEAQQQIPFPLDEVIWDYHVVDRDYVPGEERDVGLFAVRREAIDDFLLDFAESSMIVEMLSVSYLALFNFAAFDLDLDEPSIVLDLGAAHTDLILMDRDNLWIRQVPHRAEDVTRAMMQRFKLGFAEAERLKQQMGKNPQQAAKIFQAVIQPKLRDLVQEIQRSIGYYRSQAGEAKFERVVLFGNGSRLLGITKYLQEHLGIPVERAQSINHVRLNREVNVKLLQGHLPAFGAALGGALQALGVASCEVDLIPGEEKVKKAVGRKKKHAFIGAAIVLVCTLISALMVAKKLSDIAVSLSYASEVLEEPEAYEVDVQQLLEVAPTEIRKGIESLRQVGELRNAALAGLRELEAVFQDIPNGEFVKGIVAEGDKVAEGELVDQAVLGLEKKLFMPYLKVESVLFPDDDPRGGDRRSRPRSRTKKQKAVDARKVPSYKYTAFVVVKSGDSLSTNFETLTRRFKDPLETRLSLAEDGKLTYEPTVTLHAGLDQLPAIFVSDPTGDVGSQSLPSGDTSRDRQVGGPYYGALASWYIVPRKPPEEDGDGDEDDEGSE